MTPRHILMGVALAGAAALVLFGDNKPDSDVAEPAERRLPKAAPVVAAAPAQPATAGKGAAPAAVAILRLLPR
ncbi:hypothetical protein GM668_18120, partial [Duganella ginsengisoli]|nr:hypothetical protein [Pseudoduganella ginsengisoli]